MPASPSLKSDSSPTDRKLSRTSPVKNSGQKSVLTKKRLSVMIPLLETLKQMDNKQQTLLLDHLDDNAYDMIYDSVARTLQKVKKGERDKFSEMLSPFKQDLQHVIRRSKGGGVKKKVIKSIGGGPLTSLLSAAVPILVELFANKQ